MFDHCLQKEKDKMRRVIGLLAALALLLLTGCQPVMPVNSMPVGGSTQTTITSTMTTTDTSSMSVGSGMPGPVHCLIEFEATVRQGPSTGVALIGTFDFEVDEEGVLYGKLLQASGGEILAAGQVIGRAIHLVFDLGEDQTVFGVGTAKTRITNETCGLALGGPFVGPAAGDAGDWLAKQLRGNESSTPACDITCD
jgi:hypothetical protein